MFVKGVNSAFLNRYYLLGVLFIPFFISSQEDTVKVYEEITILQIHKSIEEHSTLKKEEITKLAPDDVGELLQYINGVTIKNYGGVGGMKTLSNRGLGGEHTQLLIDGLPINDPQNGQINYATIHPDNIEEISLNYQSENNAQLIPTSALLKGSNIQIKTFEQKFPTAPISIRSNSTIGSFGQLGTHLTVKAGNNLKFLSVSGGLKSYAGNYPYTLEMDENKEKYYRKNNALKDYSISLGAGLKWESKNRHIHTLLFSGNTHQIKQELPGAVILYNDYAADQLTTWNTRAGVNYSALLGKFRLSIFSNYSNRYLRYYDPNYLNIDGFIDNRYHVNSLISGFHLKYNIKDFSVHLGNDFNYENLESNRELGHPIRNSNTSMLQAQYNWKFLNIQAGVFAQVFMDFNTSQSHRKDYTNIHPQLSLFTSDQLLKDWQFFAWYKPSSRAASFNELYFSQVGNKELQPEESSQFDVGVRFAKKLQQVDIQFQLNGFKNLVKNKILALPTKNVFIWSIQNLGQVDIYGADIHFIVDWTIFNSTHLDFQFGLNYQKALDITDRNSPTYKHQIAYTPELTGNSTISLRYKSIGLHFTSLYIGQRYSLNENIPSNLLNSYCTLDISASYQLKLKESHTLKLHAGVKNVTNESYSYIRYFVMPGINYFIKLGYEFN